MTEDTPRYAIDDATGLRPEAVDLIERLKGPVQWWRAQGEGEGRFPVRDATPFEAADYLELIERERWALRQLAAGQPLPRGWLLGDANAEIESLIADGRRFRLLYRERWCCESKWWPRAGASVPTDEEDGVAAAIAELDGTPEYLDRLRAAIDHMIAAEATDPRQQDALP